ncbi:MAG: alanine racemase [Balneolaceae bacterium]
METIDQQKVERSLALTPSWIELSRAALENNLSYLREQAGDEVELCSVIKANAYGHGIAHFLPLAESCGIRRFALFSTDEAECAMQARRSSETDLLIMGAIPDDALEWVISNDLSFFVFETDRLEAVLKTVRRIGRTARIHLEIETGMHRTGIEPDQFEEVSNRIREAGDLIRLEGISTHFAGAESVANHLRIQKQRKRFTDAVAWFNRALGPIPLIHAASSAALFSYPDSTWTMVRLGIAQYGYWPSPEIQMLARQQEMKLSTRPLERLLNWKSRIMSVKEVKEGEFVGYGTLHMTGRTERIATVPVGYSQGFGRNLSNAGYVLVRGERARVVGAVNMNMLTIDVTEIDGVQRGDEVVLIGRQGEDEISLASFGEVQNNLNYEVLARLPERLPRRVV